MKYLLLIPVLLVSFVLYLTTSQTLIFEGLKWANEEYLSDYKMDLKKVDFEWNNTSLTKKNIKINTQDFCLFIMGHTNCFQKIALDLDVNLISPLNFSVNQAIVLAKKTELTLPKGEEDAGSSEIKIGSYLKLGRNILKEIAVDDLRIGLENIIIYSEGKTNRAEVSVDNKTGSKKLIGRLVYSIPDGLKIDSELAIFLSSEPKLELTTQAITKDINANVKLTATFKDESFKLSLEILKVEALQDYIIRDGQCSSSFLYEDDFEIKCTDIALRANVKKQLNFNLLVLMKIKNKIDLAASQEFLNISVEGSAKKQSAYQLGLESEITFNGSESGVEFDLKKLNIEIAIAKFRALVKELAGSRFAIPAPFNNLEGDAQLTAKLDSKLDFYNFPITGKINLDKNKFIKFASTIDTKVELSKDYEPKKVSGEVTIEDFKFYIPDIDPIFGIPEVARTDRINENIVFRPKEKSDLDIDLVIKTKSINSIKIYNQFFHPYLSMALKAKLTNETSSFDINVKDGSKIQYLKRQLEIKKVSIDNKKETTLIDAKFEYEASGYKIFLNIIGTAEKPVLLLTSFPSLPREEIISLLLYNRKSSELTGFDKASVGSTEDAISNRALGLFSIWAFASTPVDSVTYNSQTKTYSASVSLPGGTSVSIGTDWDRLNNLSFRKRLNATWAVVTSFEPTETDSKETIMLQKEISF